MKLSKVKLIKILKPNLEKLGFKEFKDTILGTQGFFIKKLENGFYLSLGLTIHRYYDGAFTGDYYVSKTTRWGAVWGDIPKESFQRPGFLLYENEIDLFQKGNINSNKSKDIWFDGNSEESISIFLKLIKLTELRFINQPELIRKIEESLDSNMLSEYADKVRMLVSRDKLQDTYKFLPSKEVDGIPMNWFKASEKVLVDLRGVLNAYTVKQLAADAYRQSNLLSYR